MIAMFTSSQTAADSGERQSPVVSNVAVLGAEVLLVHSQRPAACEPRAAMIIFPGVERNAYDYLARTSKLAKSQCLSVYAPEFDRRKFPRWRYQRGGVLRNGRLADPSHCTGIIIARLVEWVRRQERRESLPIILFGHSAGGQLLSRATAYCPLVEASRPSRIVIANPSGYVGASLDEALPYGFAMPGRPEQLLANGRDRLKSYLAQPVTIYVGSRDTGSRRLNRESGARRQGDNRFERGLNVFHEARSVAARHGWAFHWRLVIADGIGHSARGMLTSPAAARAIMPSSR